MEYKKNNQNNIDNSKPEIESGLSPVAAIPAKNIVIILIILIVGIFMLYKVVFSNSSDNKNVNKESLPKQDLALSTPPLPIDNDNPVPAIPKLPESPIIPEVTETKVEAKPGVENKTTADHQPAPIPIFDSVQETKKQEGVTFNPPIFSTNTNNTAQPVPLISQSKLDPKALQARRKSSIMVVSEKNGADAIFGSNKTETETVKRGAYIPSNTSFAQANAMTIGDTNFIIAQGKVLDAILETAINSDLPGVLRALVSRDIYAESGKRILIPKGSRLIGTYDSSIKRGQKRVLVTWNRIIRPDGLDIKLDSNGIDQIGRSGLSGHVNNRYIETIANAILLSAFNISWAKVTEKLTNTNNRGSTTSTVDPKTGSITTTSTNTSATTDAIKDSADNMGKIVESYIEESMQVKPTITVDQGSKIKVFVNRDLIFPSGFSDNFQVLK